MSDDELPEDADEGRIRDAVDEGLSAANNQIQCRNDDCRAPIFDDPRMLFKTAVGAGTSAGKMVSAMTIGALWLAITLSGGSLAIGIPLAGKIAVAAGVRQSFNIVEIFNEYTESMNFEFIDPQTYRCKQCEEEFSVSGDIADALNVDL